MAKTITERIKAEKDRLMKIYGVLEPERMEIARGLIDRAAWMRVQCEELEIFLLNNGWTEPFRQSSDLEPYDRARPQGQAYQSLNSNYQKIIRQLDGMMPDWAVTANDDGFENFVESK